ncbi:hypothetical protein D0T21_10435 [Duganella sp. BJB476]|nr:hypothetical protein D0T21_10435 [Duganella sp. BJB476]
MEMNGTFDTLSYTLRLEVAGVPPEQAEAHAAALSAVLRTQSIKEQNDRIHDAFLQLTNDLKVWTLALSISQAAIMVAALAYFRT